MMDSTMTNRPQLTWVEIRTAAGGSRLEMRWHTPALDAKATISATTGATSGATTHAA